jgi:MFS family permease
VAGPLVAAGLLLLPGVGLREVFLLTAIPAVAVMVVMAFGVREPDGLVATASRTAGAGSEGWGEAGAPFRRLVAGVALFSLGNSSDAFLLLRLGDKGLGPGRVALLWAGLHVVKMAATWWGGRLSDRWGRRRPVLAGWILYAAVYLGFGYVGSTTAFIALFLVYGVYYGLTEPVERAWVAGLAPAGSRGAAFGWYHGAIGLTALPASLIFGAIYATVGPGPAFTLGALMAVAAAVVVWGVPDHRADERAAA